MGRGNLAAVLAAIVVCLSAIGGFAGAAENAQARGDLITEGTLTFPAETALELTPVALVVQDAARLQDFELTTPRLRVCVGEATYTEADAGGSILQLPLGDFRFSCHVVTNTVVRPSEDGDNAGWLGLYPRDGTRLLSGESSLTRRTLSAVASPDMNGAATNDDEQPAWPFYHRRISENHFVLSPLDPLEVTGPGALKLKGPDVRVEASENVTNYATEDRASSDAPARERFMRWLFVEWEEGTLRLAAPPGAVTAAVADGTASWDGRLTFHAVSGSITDAAGAEYGAVQGREWIDGRFKGSITPLADEKGHLRFGGELRGSSFEARAPAAPPFVPRVSALEVGLIGAALGAATAGGGYLLLRRHRQRTGQLQPTGAGLAAWEIPALSPAARIDPDVARAYSDRAEEAADAGRFLLAVDLLAKARQADPTMPTLALREGIYWFKAGELPRALANFDDAAQGANTPEPATWAAVCAALMHDPETARFYVVRALDACRTLAELGEVEVDARLAPILGEPEALRALKAARRRLGADDDSESQAAPKRDA